jgi:hypothetical protein
LPQIPERRHLSLGIRAVQRGSDNRR